jgi:hypothetical protein
MGGRKRREEAGIGLLVHLAAGGPSLEPTRSHHCHNYRHIPPQGQDFAP